MELFSTTIFLRSLRSINLLPYTGGQVQGWFFDALASLDQRMASQIHGENGSSDPRPYTLSPVYKGDRIVYSLKAGDVCWVRITSLTKEVSEFLAGKALPECSKHEKLKVAQIGYAEFDVQPWSRVNQIKDNTGEISYARLKAQASRLNGNGSQIWLDFRSPTSFKHKNEDICDNPNVEKGEIEKDVPLPISEMVFGSYIKRWKSFSKVKLDADLGKFIEENVAVNLFENLSSSRVEFSKKNRNEAATCFSGRVKFVILPNKEKSRFRNDWDDYVCQVHMLALYSFYCGTGNNTTSGLGQTFPDL